VDAAYRWVDETVGAIQARLPDDAVVLLVSDHGMHAHNRRARFDPDDPSADANSGHHDDAPPGVIVAAGPPVPSSPATPLDAVEIRQIPVVGSVEDVAATVLAVEGLPIGRDMDGAVLHPLLRAEFLESHPPARITSHEPPGWRPRPAKVEYRSEAERERLEQLRALGCIE